MNTEHVVYMDIFLGDDYIDDENAEASARDERLRRAFQESKDSYKNERVALTPGWFVCGPADVPTIARNQKLGLQNIGNST